MRFFLMAMTLFVSACSNVLPDWLGAEEEEIRLEGDRISVLQVNTGLTAQPDKSRAIIAPQMTANEYWNLQQMQPAEHMALAETIKRFASVSIGAGAGERLRLTAHPVVAKDMIFAIDGKGRVTARSVSNPDRVLWTHQVEVGQKPETSLLDKTLSFGTAGSDEFMGGNVTYANGHVLVSTALGTVVKLDGETGELVWQRELKLPICSAPVYSDGMVYVVTSNSRLYALSDEDGGTNWTYDGIAETTSIFGAPRPVIDEELVIIAFASGELVALDKQSGKPKWKDILINEQGSFASLVGSNDINATPVVHNGSVYAVSHDGVLAAYNRDTGSKRWTQDVAAVQMPWIAGDFLFLLTTQDEIAAISTLDGRVQWVKQLPRYGDVTFDWGGENKGDPLDWFGPVLAGNALWMTTSEGGLYSVDVFRGEVHQQAALGDAIYLPPIISHKKLMVLTNGGKLVVYQ